MTIKIEYNAPSPKKPMVLYDSVFARGTLTASSEAVGGDVANALDEQTSDYWTATTDSSNMTVELPVAERVDCLAIAAHNMATEGATVAVQRSENGTSWTTVSTVTPTTDDVVLVLFKPVVALWWRIVVTGGACNLGIVRLGSRLVFPSGINTGYTPINLARRIEVQGGITVGGQFSGQRIIRRGANTTVSVAPMDRSFVDNDMAAFHLHYDEARSFFWAGGPSIMPNDVAYCWRPATGGEIRPMYVESGELAEFSMNIEAFVHA